jgi:hypothetical protein
MENSGEQAARAERARPGAPRGRSSSRRSCWARPVCGASSRVTELEDVTKQTVLPLGRQGVRLQL